jgi:hypothetical protein
MRTIGIAIEPVVADIDGARQQTERDKGESDLLRECDVVPGPREQEAGPDERVLDPLLRPQKLPIMHNRSPSPPAPPRPTSPARMRAAPHSSFTILAL